MSRERRWTLLVVPHGSEALRSLSVSERAVRWLVYSAAGVVIIVTLCFTILLTRLGSLEHERAMVLDASTADGQVDALRAQLAQLNGSIDSIHQTDALLRAAVGTTAPAAPGFWSRLLRRVTSERARTDSGRTRNDSARAELRSAAHAADSLLVRAGEVSVRLGQLADSVRGARGAARVAAPTEVR